MKKTAFLLFWFWSANLCLASSNVNYERTKEKYSKYNAVVLNREFNYIFDIVADSLTVTQHNTKEVLIINDYSKGFANDIIFTGSFSKIENIKAATLLPRGRRFNRINVTHFKESHDRDGSIFYDDSETIQFTYPSLQRGAITSLKYTINYLNPRFINHSYFQSFIPTLKTKVVAKVHKDVKIGFKLFHTEGYGIDFKQYTKGNYVYYVWETADVEPFKYLGANHFSINYYAPHLAIFVDEIKTSAGTQNFYGTIEELYNFYTGFISQVDETPSDDLVGLVKDLTEGLDDIDKAKKIYYWIQNNIKYIAYLQGYMGFVPRPPNEVFAKRFGDCKGMSSLTRKMMELAGIPAYYTWVGTRRIPYTYNQLPLPSVDNHMVTTFIYGDSIIVMDGTFNYLDFGLYPFHLQGKELLIAINNESYRIFEVPVSPSSISTVNDSINIELLGRSIAGNGVRRHTGYNKYELASAMSRVKENDYSRRFSTLFMKGNNKFKVTDYQIINIYEPEKPAEVHYNYLLEDYINLIGDELYINLNLDRSLHNLKIDTTSRYSPVVNDFAFTERHISRFAIPHGYEVSFIPEDDHLTMNKFGFSIKYWVDENSIICEKVVELNFLILLEDNFKQWNTMIDRLNQNYRKSIVLKKIN